MHLFLWCSVRSIKNERCKRMLMWLKEVNDLYLLLVDLGIVLGGSSKTSNSDLMGRSGRHSLQCTPRNWPK